MSLDPLILCGHDNPARLLSVSSYREPAMQPRINYAPTGDDHGDVPLSWSYQETLLGFNAFAEDATDEDDLDSRIAELTAALGRLIYPVTVTKNGGTPVTWTCRAGAVAPTDDRTSADLQDHTAMWAVTIPAYPIRSV